MDLSYAYANARIKAMRSKLLGRDEMRELVDVKTTPEFVELLEEGPYKQSFVNASTRFTGSELVKKALDEDLAASFRKIESIVPAKAKALVHRLLKNWEVNNIKKIIALKALGRSALKQDLLLVNGSELLFSSLLQQKDLQGVLKTLSASEYGPALRKATVHYNKSGDYRVLLAALDEHYCRQLALLLREEKDELVRKFMQKKISVTNAVTSLRLRKSGVSASKTRAFLIDAPDQEFCGQMAASKSLKEAVEIAAAHLKTPIPTAVLEKAVATGELASIEELFERQLLVQARKTLSRSVLSPGVVVGYLYLKQEEVHALRMVSYASQFEVKQDIREMVLARL